MMSYNDKIKAYLDSVFADSVGIGNDSKKSELKEELLANMSERYSDYIADGKSEDEAYEAVITSLGDIREIMGEFQTDSDIIKRNSKRPTEHKPSGKFVHRFDGVRSINIKSSNLDIIIKESDVDSVVLTDNSVAVGGGQKPENAVYMQGDTLHFEQDNTRTFPFVWFSVRQKGSVLIEIPRGTALEYDIASASGDISLGGGFFSQATIKTASGDVTTTSEGGYINVSTASGDIQVKKSIKSIKLHSVSGDITMQENGEEIEVKTVSGDIKMFGTFVSTIVKTTSGDIKMCADDRSVVVVANTVSGDCIVQLDGISELNLHRSSVSGSKKNSYKIPDNVQTAKLHMTVGTVSGDLRLRDWV